MSVSDWSDGDAGASRLRADEACVVAARGRTDKRRRGRVEGVGAKGRCGRVGERFLQREREMHSPVNVTTGRRGAGIAVVLGVGGDDGLQICTLATLLLTVAIGGTSNLLSLVQCRLCDVGAIHGGSMCGRGGGARAACSDVVARALAARFARGLQARWNTRELAMETNSDCRLPALESLIRCRIGRATLRSVGLAGAGLCTALGGPLASRRGLASLASPGHLPPTCYCLLLQMLLRLLFKSIESYARARLFQVPGSCPSHIHVTCY
jgi:hypothetical protein